MNKARDRWPWKKRQLVIIDWQDSGMDFNQRSRLLGILITCDGIRFEATTG